MLPIRRSSLGNCQCTYRALFRFHRLVALYQWSKYKNSIFDHFRTLKWRHQVAILNLCSVEAIQNFLLYHMQKTFFAYLYPKKKVAKFLWEPKKNDLTIFFVTLSRRKLCATHGPFSPVDLPNNWQFYNEANQRTWTRDFTPSIYIS